VEYPRVIDRGRAGQNGHLRQDVRGARRAREHLGEEGFGLYEQQIAAIRKSVEKAEADADPPLVIAKAILHALTSHKPKTKYLAGHGGRETAVAAALPDHAREAVD
jgi:hypothetical protein